ncbi:MAG TPA: hypothetical protein VEO53_09310 [Candidatus Binatia bacterium]|nr:hypothetical protein [Candidatus Binatia bacterium]
MAGSERAIPNSAKTDARATDGTAGKSQTSAAAGKTPSTYSDMPTEATTSAATATWTGFRSVGDRGNCEEQDRAGDYASHHAGLGGRGRFQCRCARQRQEGLTAFLQTGSALRRREQNVEMAHGSPPKLNNFCRNVSLSAHCDKRKEKDRLFVGVDPCYPASTAREMHRDEDVTHGIGALRWRLHTGGRFPH